MMISCCPKFQLIEDGSNLVRNDLDDKAIDFTDSCNAAT